MSFDVPADAFFPDEIEADCFEVCAHSDNPVECYRRCVEAQDAEDVDEL